MRKNNKLQSRKRSGAPVRRGKYAKSPDTSGGRVQIYRNPRVGPFPTVYPAVLHYRDYFDMAMAINTLNYTNFRANSLYDPDASGVGHQPLYFDQLAALYARYRVTGLRYSVRFFAPDESTNAYLSCYVLTRNGTYTPSLPSFGELPFSKKKATSSYAQPVTVSGRVDLTTLNTARTIYMNDDRYAAEVTTNPAEVINFFVGAVVNQAIFIRYEIDMFYECQFYDPIPPSDSFTDGKDHPFPAIFCPKKKILVQ